jgi:hypothetical protein
MRIIDHSFHDSYLGAGEVRCLLLYEMMSMKLTRLLLFFRFELDTFVVNKNDGLWNNICLSRIPGPAVEY